MERKELTEGILRLTMLIQEKYPELMKYLSELQETLPVDKHPEVDSHALEKYYETLDNMIMDYRMEHPELG